MRGGRPPGISVSSVCGLSRSASSLDGTCPPDTDSPLSVGIGWRRGERTGRCVPNLGGMGAINDVAGKP